MPMKYLLPIAIMPMMACGRAEPVNPPPRMETLLAPEGLGAVSDSGESSDRVDAEAAGDTHTPDTGEDEPGPDTEGQTEGGESGAFFGGEAVIIGFEPQVEEAPMGASADLRGPNSKEPALEESSFEPSPHIDRSFENGPIFPDNDPLESSPIPACRALVQGIRNCLPKLDKDIGKIIEPLLASVLNSARSLKRTPARTKACEMGINSFPSMLEPFCPGAFGPAAKAK